MLKINQIIEKIGFGIDEGVYSETFVKAYKQLEAELENLSPEEIESRDDELIVLFNSENEVIEENIKQAKAKAEEEKEEAEKREAEAIEVAAKEAQEKEAAKAREEEAKAVAAKEAEEKVAAQAKAEEEAAKAKKLEAEKELSHQEKLNFLNSKRVFDYNELSRLGVDVKNIGLEIELFGHKLYKRPLCTEYVVTERPSKSE